jgi:membrane associated rhomboid family serine protease
MMADPPKRGVRAPKKIETAAKEKPAAVPWASIMLFCLCSFASAVAAKYPFLYDKFGFLPRTPLRFYGLPWLGGILLNKPAHINGLIALLFFGSYTERQIGARGLFTLCAVAWVASLVTCIPSASDYSEPFVGSLPVILAVFAYAAITFPYKKYLFPEERWKSPVDALSWMAIALLLFFVVFVLIDVLNQELAGMRAAIFDSPVPAFVVPILGPLLFNAKCLPYVTGAAIGFLSGLILRKKNS